MVQPLIEGQPIETLLAEVGDRVQKGEVLARLSDSTLKLQESQFAAQRASALASDRAGRGAASGSEGQPRTRPRA